MIDRLIDIVVATILVITFLFWAAGMLMVSFPRLACALLAGGIL